MTGDALTRRDCLALLATGTAGLAGCSVGDDGENPGSSPTDPGTEPATTATADPDGDSISLVARPVGLVAEYDPDGGTESEAEIRTAVAAAMPAVHERDVHVDGSTGIVEVRADANATAVVEGLRQAGVAVSPDDVRRGVGEDTLEQLRGVVRDRLENTGYSDPEARVANASGDATLVVEAAGANRTAVRDLLDDRGRVRLVASFPASGDGETGQREVTLATQGDVARVGEVQRPSGSRPPSIPVTLESEAAQDLADGLVEHGFTDEGVSSCRWQDDQADPGYCIYTVVDGEVRYAASLAPSLAQTMQSGEWAEDPQFVMQTADEAAARELRRNLLTGPLPTPLEVEDPSDAS